MDEDDILYAPISKPEPEPKAATDSDIDAASAEVRLTAREPIWCVSIQPPSQILGFENASPSVAQILGFESALLEQLVLAPFGAVSANKPKIRVD